MSAMLGNVSKSVRSDLRRVCDGFEADVADDEAKERHPRGSSNCYAIVPSNWMVPLCATRGERKGNEDRTTLSTKCPLERTEILCPT